MREANGRASSPKSEVPCQVFRIFPGHSFHGKSFARKKRYALNDERAQMHWISLLQVILSLSRESMDLALGAISCDAWSRKDYAFG